MRTRLTLIILLSGCIARAGAQGPAPRCSSGLLFASDTQQPMLIEKLWLKGHENHMSHATDEPMRTYDMAWIWRELGLAA